MMTPREHAKAAGLKKYDGRICPKCQGSERYVSMDQCVRCVAATAAARHAVRTKVSAPSKPAPFQADPGGGLDRAAIRQAAKAAGAPRYDPGEPCVNGHQSPRYVSNDQCVACTSAANAVQRAARNGRALAVETQMPEPAIETQPVDAIADADEAFGQKLRDAEDAAIDRVIESAPALQHWTREDVRAGIAAGLFKVPPAETTPTATSPPETPPGDSSVISDCVDRIRKRLAEQEIADAIERDPRLGQLSSDELSDMAENGTLNDPPTATEECETPADPVEGLTGDEPELTDRNSIQRSWDDNPTAAYAHSDEWHREHGYVVHAGQWVDRIALAVQLAHQEAVEAEHAWREAAGLPPRQPSELHTYRRRNIPMKREIIPLPLGDR